MILQVKVAEYLTVQLPDNATYDEQWKALDDCIKKNRANMGFVIDAVNVNGAPDATHALVDETIG